MPTKELSKKKDVKRVLKKKKVTASKSKTTAKPKLEKLALSANAEEKSLVLEELSPKDLQTLKEITKAKSKTRLEALKKAGVPLSRADIGHAKAAFQRIARKPLARVAFRAILRRKGVNLDYLATHMKDGLEATRTISVIPGKQKSNGDQQDASGSSVEFVSVPDWSARHKYFQLAIQIENITVEEVAQGGDEESYVDKILRLRKIVKDREQDQEAMDVEMVES
ncbi:MAG: hypothetical protein ABGX83_05460 [Nitrospira sp.]